MGGLSVFLLSWTAGSAPNSGPVEDQSAELLTANGGIFRPPLGFQCGLGFHKDGFFTLDVLGCALWPTPEAAAKAAEVLFLREIFFRWLR